MSQQLKDRDPTRIRPFVQQKIAMRLLFIALVLLVAVIALWR